VEDKKVEEHDDEEEEMEEDGGKYWAVTGGKRQRAKTERTVPEAPAEDRKKSRVGEAGKGTALSDMSRVCDNLSKIESKSRSLKILHKVLFGTDGQETMRKRQIRMFSGLVGVTAEDSTRVLSKFDGKEITTLQQILDIKNRGTTKAEKVSNLVAFLLNPTVQHETAKAKKKPAGSTKRKRDESDDDDDDAAAIKKLKKQLELLENKIGDKKSKSATKSKKKPAATKTRKTKQPKKVKEGPKRPQSAYFLWMAEARAETKKANPEASIGELGKIMGKAWNKLSDEKKKPFAKKATALSDAYKVAKAEFDKKKAGNDDDEPEEAEEEEAEEAQEEAEAEEEAEEAKAEEAKAEEGKEDEPEEAAKEVDEEAAKDEAEKEESKKEE